jgi:septal ring-binding cell division protein DamX
MELSVASQVYYSTRNSILREDKMLQDRRQSPRLAPASPLLVHVGDHNTGLLFNLSECGLAVDGLLPDIQGDVFSLALELPDANVHIVGTAQAAWTSNSGHRTGMRFVHLSDSTRQQLKEWISERAAVAQPEPSPPILPARATQPQLDFAPAPLELTVPVKVANREAFQNQAKGKLRRTLSLILTIAPLSSALVLLGYYLGNRGDYHPSHTLAAAPKLPELAAPAPVEAAPPLAAPSTSLPSTLSLDNPGFVLQVAAMQHEDYADALSSSLQKKNFPAFVFKRNSEHLYKVAVGSYPDANSAIAAQHELEKQGFTAILLRWSPN